MLKSFIKLDFLTAKIGFSPTTLIFYLVLIAALTILMRSLTQTVWLLMYFMNGFVLLPFSIGEPRQMDTLYITLNIDRRTVVRGRYVYSLIMLACGIALSSAIVGIGILSENIFDIDIHAVYSLLMIPALGLMLVITHIIELPIVFKFTLVKSGIFTSIPYILLMIGAMLFTGRLMNEEFLERFSRFTENTPLVLGAAAGIVLVICVLFYISYRLSVAFYSRRDF